MTKYRVSAEIVEEHIFFAGGSKTVCASAVLSYFGVSPKSYHYSGTVAQRSAILRRNGWAVRSRNSTLGKAKTMGALKKAIQSSGKDPGGTHYMVRVQGAGSTHALLLGHEGDVLVDTAPRKRDRRRVLDVRAVFPKGADKSLYSRGLVG